MSGVVWGGQVKVNTWGSSAGCVYLGGPVA